MQGHFGDEDDPAGRGGIAVSPGRTEWRDARLARALDEAPDAQLRPLDRTRDAIRAAAREAIAPQAEAPWWRRWWEASGRRSTWTPALATVLLAGLVTLLWRGEEVPTAQPDAKVSRAPAAPAPALGASEMDRRPAATPAPQSRAPELRDAPVAPAQRQLPQLPQARDERAERKAPAVTSAQPAAATDASQPPRAAQTPTPTGPSPAPAPTPAPAAALPPPAARPGGVQAPAEPAPAATGGRREANVAGEMAARQAPPVAAEAAAPAGPSRAAPAAATAAAPTAPAAAPAPPQPAAVAPPTPAAARSAPPESRGDLSAAPLARARGDASDASSDRLAKSTAPATAMAASPQREGATAFQAQQLSWEAWTELRITAEGRAVVLARRRVPELADSLNRMARLAQSTEALQEPVRASFELSSRGNLLGVLEVGDTQVRWLPLGERGPSRTVRPDPALLQAVRDQAAVQLPR